MRRCADSGPRGDNRSQHPTCCRAEPHQVPGGAAALLAAAEIGVLLDTGPEVISGSTRLKAGTAQKIALNSFSSACMVRLHKVYGNLMVDLRATNAKLVKRALRLTARASGADEAAAQVAPQAAGLRVKTAIVMLKAGVDAATAEARLAAAEGSVQRALDGR